MKKEVNIFGHWFKKSVVVGASGLLLSGCLTTTPTPTSDKAPSLAPSATVLPIIPTEIDDIAIGRSDPTHAALAAEGQPSQEPVTYAPLPTMPFVPLQFLTATGTTVEVILYGASLKPAPSALIVHDEASTTWEPLAIALQNIGYNVYLYKADSLLTVSTVVENAQAITGINNGIWVMIGIGTGAGAAWQGCDTISGCSQVVLISPLGIEAPASTRGLFFLSADDDPISTEQAAWLSTQTGATWQRYSSGGHGSRLLTNQPDSIARIIGWLRG